MELHVQQATHVETIGSITVAYNSQLDASLHKLIKSFEPPPRYDGHVCAGAFGVIQPEDTSLLQIVVTNGYSQLVTPLRRCSVPATDLPEALGREWDAYVSAVRDSETAIERGREHLSSLGLTPAAERSPVIVDERPTWNLASYTTYFLDYQAFGERIGIVTDESGVPIEIGAGVDMPRSQEWRHFITGEAAINFIRQAHDSSSDSCHRAQELEAFECIHRHMAEYANELPALASWAQSETPEIAVTPATLTVEFHDQEGNPAITFIYSATTGEREVRLTNGGIVNLKDLADSPHAASTTAAMGAPLDDIQVYLDSLSRSAASFHTQALDSPLVSAVCEARTAQAVANLKAQRENMPSDVLGGRPTYATAQGASKPMRWMLPAPLHRTEGRSL